jgi:hypothetical protein
MLGILVEKIGDINTGNLIVISLELHHKQQTKTRSKRPLNIAERPLGTGSMAAGWSKKHCKDGKMVLARCLCFSYQKGEVLEDELIDGVKAADTK